MDRPFQLVIEKHRDNEMRMTLYQRRLRNLNSEGGDAEQLVSILGDPMHLATDTIIAILRDAGHGGAAIRPGNEEVFELDENQGVRLGLLMFALKPLRKARRIKAVCVAISTMSLEAASYWFSKAANGYDYNTRRRHMRALRILLAEE